MRLKEKVYSKRIEDSGICGEWNVLYMGLIKTLVIFHKLYASAKQKLDNG